MKISFLAFFPYKKKKKKITGRSLVDVVEHSSSTSSFKFPLIKKRMHRNYEAIYPFNFSERDEIVSSSTVFSLRIAFLVLTV